MLRVRLTREALTCRLIYSHRTSASFLVHSFSRLLVSRKLPVPGKSHFNRTVCVGSRKSDNSVQTFHLENIPGLASSNKVDMVKPDIGNGVFFLLLANLALFALDHVFHLPWVRTLYLNHRFPQWWQYITCCFCHYSWEHLSANLFSLYIFGRIVEEEGGAFGLLTTYFVCGVGASVASYLSQPGSYVTSLGASGAIFGLYVVGVLLKFTPDIRKLLGAFVLGQFVVQQVLQEVRAQAGTMSGKGLTVLGGAQVGHVAHLGGALVGVLLIWMLWRLPEPEQEQ